MRTKRSLILFFVLALSCFNSSSAQPSSNCLAVITEINGKALLKEAGKSQFSKATWGSRLFVDDQVATDDKSEVKVLFSNNNLIILGPNSMITISGKDTPVTEPKGDIRTITSSAMVNLSSLTIKRDEKKDEGALAGVRSITTNKAIEPESPYNTLIKTDRPSFSWLTKSQFDNFTVNLYNSRGLVWSRKVSDLNLTYPENEKGLEFGESYFWNVEGEYLIDSEKSANHKFTVLSLEKSKDIEANEVAIRNAFKDNPESSSLHSVLGAYYIDKGLLQDAVMEFMIISKINSDAAIPHQILGSLYSEMGEKDKAIEELQKALILATGKE